MAAGLSASDGFGAAQLRRLFLPGVIAAVGLGPFVTDPLLEILGPIGVDRAWAFVIEALLFGLLLTSGLQSILYLYQGFTAPWLTGLSKRWLTWRVEKLNREFEALAEAGRRDEPRVVWIQEYLLDFPRLAVEDGYTYEVERNTRLGNILASAELYPERTYGIDAVFYWHHIRYLAGKEIREDVDGLRLNADSMALGSAAGALSGLVALTTLIGLKLGDFLPAIAVFPSPIAAGSCGWLMLFGLGAFALFYRLSWPAYREFRDSFQAMVDLTVVQFAKWLKDSPDSTLREVSKLANERWTFLTTFEMPTQPSDPGDRGRETPPGTRPEEERRGEVPRDAPSSSEVR